MEVIHRRFPTKFLCNILCNSHLGLLFNKIILIILQFARWKSRLQPIWNISLLSFHVYLISFPNCMASLVDKSCGINWPFRVYVSNDWWSIYVTDDKEWSIPVAVRSMALFSDALFMGLRVRIQLRAWALFSCVCSMLCRKRPLRRANRSFRWVLPVEIV
jgi:hypothetical protein